jgi:hypothetical protein
MNPLLNHVVVAGFICLLSGCEQHGPDPFDLSGFDGPAIQMLIDDRVVCVPRRLLHPYEAKEFAALRNPDGTVRPVTPHRMRLATFLPQLDGYTDSQYVEYVRNHYNVDGNHNSPTRVHIDLINSEIADSLDRVREQTILTFETSESVDALGFVTRKAKPECVGKRASAGAFIAIELGPECALAELKYRNPSAPELTLVCAPTKSNSRRCQALGAQSVDGIQFEYQPEIINLPQWIELHRKVLKRVKQLAADTSCFGSIGANPTVHTDAAR